jgi:type IV secretion system protein VirD4
MSETSRLPELRNDRPLIFILALGLVVAFGIATQYVAWRLAFAPELGPALVVFDALTRRLLRAMGILLLGAGVSAVLVRAIRRSAGVLFVLALIAFAASAGPLYPPHRLLVWHAAYARVPWLSPVFRTGWGVLALNVAAVLVAIFTAWPRPRSPPPSRSHGSAHWGSGAGLRRERGFLLGRHRDHLLRLEGEGHVLTVAPTRSGKGVSCVIPNLLDHPGSILVTDPKGENYAVTSRWREELGQEVHAFDPFTVVGGSAAYNPLDLVDRTSPDAVDDARMLADMLVLPEGREGDQAFWNEEARAVLAGLILHVAASAPAELRTLTHVRTLLTLPPELFRHLLDEMSESQAIGGLVARAAARILQKAERERSGVISTAQSHTHFLDSPRMATVLGRSTVDLRSLKRERMTLYLVLPAERLDGYARWLRVMIACGLLAIARTPGQPEKRVLFLLDEFAHLRRMHPVQRDIGLAGGYGVTFWLVIQDLAQLRSTYPDTWPTFLANVDVLQAFGTNDWDTAEYLSKMTGEATVSILSDNRSTGVSRGRSPQRQLGAAVTRSETGRRLLLPDEVRRLSRERQLLFVKGSAPILAERVTYLGDREFAGKADPNPLYAPVVTGVRSG